MTSSNSSKPDWGITPRLTNEQIITWLEGHRALMWEIWKNNPGTREKWEKLNGASSKRTDKEK